MPRLRIDHRTSYAYLNEVSLGPHRLLLRPREGRDLRLLWHEISAEPDVKLDWTTDIFGNAVALANFEATTDALVISSVAEIDLLAPAWPVFAIAGSAITYPFRYSDDDWIDLGALAVPQYADPFGRLDSWARAFIAGGATDTLSLLKDLNSGVHNAIAYQSRDIEGTQSPTQTLERGWGSCRDLAVLFAEAARIIGFGARMVSGYLFNPDQQAIGSAGLGASHAWADIFIPGAGWISFDPTNCTMGAANLIPVSATRNIAQSIPIAGSFVGSSGANSRMDVAVQVRELEPSRKTGKLRSSGL